MAKRSAEDAPATPIDLLESADAKATRRAAKKARKSEAAQAALEVVHGEEAVAAVSAGNHKKPKTAESNLVPAVATAVATAAGGEEPTVETEEARAARKQAKRERRASRMVSGAQEGESTSGVGAAGAGDADDDNAGEDEEVVPVKAPKKGKEAKGKQQKMRKVEKEIAKMDAKIAKEAKKVAIRDGKAPASVETVAVASGSGALDPALLEADMDDILAALQGGSRARTTANKSAGVADALKTLQSGLVADKRAKKALLPSAIKAKAGAAANKAAKKGAAAIDYSKMNAAEVLSTQWLSAKDLKQLTEDHGIVFKKGKFSVAEDALMHAAIDLFAIEHGMDKTEVSHLALARGAARRELPQAKLFWTSIASAVEGRPVSSVYKRVVKILDPAHALGKWTAEELAALKAGFLQHGSNWVKIAETVGRSAGDCRDRWTSAANAVTVEDGGTHKRGKWSSDEEEKLKVLVGEHGQSWTVIAKLLTTRTRSQCKTKWTDEMMRRGSEGHDGKWSAKLRGNLVVAVAALDVDDVSEIDWKDIVDPVLKPHGPANLQSYWRRLLGKTGLADDADHRARVKVLLEKYPVLEGVGKKIVTAKEKAATKKVVKKSGLKAKETAFKSQEFITESDDEE